jgi:hypothetical protein
VDLFIFFLCALIIFASDTWPWLSTGIITFGALVKMFPFFGLAVLLKKERAYWFGYFSISFTILFIYMLSTLNNVSASWNQTMRGEDLSYGTNVLFAHFETGIRGMFSIFPAALAGVFFKYGPLLFALLLLILIFNKASKGESLLCESQRNLDLFRMGAGVYIGTFLLGNNWDYRLAFLVLIIPQVSKWAGVQTASQKVSIVTLIAACISAWYLLFRKIAEAQGAELMLFIYFVDEFMNWVLLSGLFYLFIASSPEWVRNFHWKQLLKPRELFS